MRRSRSRRRRRDSFWSLGLWVVVKGGVVLGGGIGKRAARLNARRRKHSPVSKNSSTSRKYQSSWISTPRGAGRANSPRKCAVNSRVKRSLKIRWSSWKSIRRNTWSWARSGKWKGCRPLCCFTKGKCWTGSKDCRRNSRWKIDCCTFYNKCRRDGIAKVSF